MKHTLTALLVLLFVTTQAQLFTEIGVAPINSRMRTSVAASVGYRAGDFELTAPGLAEFGHNMSAGLTAGYRFTGSYVQGDYGTGLVLHAGMAHSWYGDNAKQSGEMLKAWQPVVGLKWCEAGHRVESTVFELRYQGGAIAFLFAVRL